MRAARWLLVWVACLGACNRSATSGARLIDAGAAPTPSAPGGPSGADALVGLVDANAWQAVPLADDPFAAWADGEVECSPLAGYYPELGGLEIDTSRCNFVTLSQPPRSALPANAELELELIHFDLTATEPTSARLALAFHTASGPTNVVVWERSVAIPGPANRIVERFRPGRALSLEDRVLFHLQNHGQNTWRLMRVEWRR